MNKWISVKDRLPTEFGYYLVVCSNKSHPQIRLWDDAWDDIFHSVTHWMPLPEPPIGKDELTLIDNNVMIWTDGENFKCCCGGNVFTKYKTSNNKIIYECHSCNTKYEGE